MKKLLLLLLFTSMCSAQSTYAILQADVRNATFGSAPTNDKAKPDLMLRLGFIGTENPGKNIKGGIAVEYFPAIEFVKYCAEIGYVFPKFKLFKINLQLQSSLEFGWIDRYALSTWCVGANVDLIYMITDKIGIIITDNLLSRTDLNEMYGGNNWRFSNYAGAIYKF